MRATMRDVARLSGTSVAAVSKVLNGSRSKTSRVGDRARERILLAAEQLGYTTNPIARSLATGRAGVVGVLLPYVEAFVDGNPFSITVLQGIMREAIRRHLNVTLYTAIDGMSSSAMAEQIDSRVDGVVLLMPEPDGPVVHRLDRLGIPYVSILRPPCPNAWTVNSDDYRGACLATRHLAELGHRRVMHLAGNPRVSTTSERIRGFQDTLQEFGIEPLVIPAGFDWRNGFEAVLTAFHDEIPATALFAGNDLCALGAMQALASLGLNIPDDAAVVGYDDTWRAEQAHPPLTSVHMGVESLGTTALSTLIRVLEGDMPSHRDQQLPVSLTVRQSCGANKRFATTT